RQRCVEDEWAPLSGPPCSLGGPLRTRYVSSTLDAVAQREAIVEPDPMADDLAGKAVMFVACGISGWRHVGCLSSGWLGPRGHLTLRRGLSLVGEPVQKEADLTR